MQAGVSRGVADELTDRVLALPVGVRVVRYCRVEYTTETPRAKVSGMPWFSVRSVYRFGARLGGRDVYEERVVLFDASDAESAISMAEAEAAGYAADIEGGEVMSLFQSFWLFDEPSNGAEVFSLSRISDLAPDDYIDRFFDTGEERQQHVE